jgi:hypothetical protein
VLEDKHFAGCGQRRDAGTYMDHDPANLAKNRVRVAEPHEMIGPRQFN